MTLDVDDRGDQPWIGQACGEPFEENARLRAVLGRCPRCIAVLDERGQLVGFNRAFARLFDPRPRLGGRVGNLFDATRGKLVDLAVLALVDEGDAAMPLHLRTSGGREVELVMAILPTNAGLAGVVLAGEDCTDRVEAESERAAAATTGDQRNSDTAFDLAQAVLAHDLANAVSVAMLSMEILTSPGAAEARPQLAHDALEALKHVSALVDQARKRAMAVPTPGPERVQVQRCVGGVVRVLRYGASRRGITLVGNVPEDLHVAMGATELTQILTNLVSNSIHAIEDAKREGRVEVFADAQGSSLQLHVRDDGVGIEPSRLERVFHPYETSRAAQGGSGLGLAIAKRLVESAGGRIRAVSTPGKGTDVVVELPTASVGPCEPCTAAGQEPSSAPHPYLPCVAAAPPSA